MQEQLTMFPATHSNDPLSSFEAEDEITASGIRGQQMLEVFDLVTLNPGKTSLELSIISKFDRYQIARRTSDLFQIGRLKKGELRSCRVGGRLSVTWWPV